jgi:hypothetical protein
MKDAGMRIRIEQSLRDSFVAVCKSEDVPAAQVLRQFMKTYVEKSTISSRIRKQKQTTGNKNG